MRVIFFGGGSAIAPAPSRQAAASSGAAPKAQIWGLSVSQARGWGSAFAGAVVSSKGGRGTRTSAGAAPSRSSCKAASAAPVAALPVVNPSRSLPVMVGHRLVAQASRTVMPSKASKEVRQDGKDFVASYVDVDPNEVTTEMHPSNAGQYVGYVRYQEKMMECRGKSRKEAITTASCQQVKARNINELIRYDGSTWQY